MHRRDSQDLEHCFLEWTLWLTGTGNLGLESTFRVAHIFEIAAQLTSTWLLRRNILGAQRVDDCHRLACPGHSNIEPTFTSISVDRAEAVWNSSRRGRSVSDGEDHVIALIALDILQVLDEKALGEVAAEPLVQMTIEQTTLLDEVVYEVCLWTRKRDDPDAFLTGSLRLHQLEHNVSDAFSLIAVGPAATRLVGRVRKVYIAN